jgi:hypothetical protein
MGEVWDQYGALIASGALLVPLAGLLAWMLWNLFPRG